MPYLFGYLVVGEQRFESGKNWNSELYNISFHLYHTFQLNMQAHIFKQLYMQAHIFTKHY